MRHLTQYYVDAWPAVSDTPGHTWTVDNPVAATEITRLLGDPTIRRRIDYILTTLPITSAGLIQTADNTYLSDHYGLYADLT